MIRFINIDNGRTFNGDMPYVHWFDGQQSTDLIYVQKICILSDQPTLLFRVPENEVFHLLDLGDHVVPRDPDGLELAKHGISVGREIIKYVETIEDSWLGIPMANRQILDAELDYLTAFLDNIEKTFYDQLDDARKRNIANDEIEAIGFQTYLTISNTDDTDGFGYAIMSYIDNTLLPLSTFDSEEIGKRRSKIMDRLNQFMKDLVIEKIYDRVINPKLKSCLTSIDGLSYNDISKLYVEDTHNIYKDSHDHTYTVHPGILNFGAPYGYNKYVYMMYIAASSPVAFEARHTFMVAETELKYSDPGYIDYKNLAVYDEDGNEVTDIYNPKWISYNIGADFYGEREELKINLSNYGLDLPESVQKAIYPSNVHEEAKDNILMNRKYKELLLNYAEIIVNKGSYASLLNSLNWFEYGDILRIREFWKHNEWLSTVYNDQDFKQLLTDKVKDSLSRYSKTTYLGIYCACQQETGSNETIEYPETAFRVALRNFTTDRALDRHVEPDDNVDLQFGVGESFIEKSNDEFGDGPILDGAFFEEVDTVYKNMQRFLAEPIPALKQASMLWSRSDMAIKMALLGNFFSTYFTPVHLDLIHSTIEDLVYADTIKTVADGTITREDYFINDKVIKCSVNDGDVFMLGDVKVQANSKTPFVNKANDESDYDTHAIIGVNKLDENSLKLQEKAFKYRETLQNNLLIGRSQVLVESDFLTAPAATRSGSTITSSPNLILTTGTIETIRGQIVNSPKDTIKWSSADQSTIEEAVKTVQTNIDHIVQSNGYATIPQESMPVQNPDGTYDTTKYDNEIKTILLNNYTGVGVVIPFTFVIPVDKGDVIFKEVLCIENDETRHWERIEFEHKYAAIQKDINDASSNEYYIAISFNMLCTRDREYDMRMQFMCTNGQTYIKRVKFTTVDTRRAALEVYKLKTIRRAVSREANDFMFTHMIHENHCNDELHNYYTQYVPVNTSMVQEESDGVKLKLLIITRANWLYNTRTWYIEDVVDSVIKNDYLDLYNIGIDARAIYRLKGDVQAIKRTIVGKVGSNKFDSRAVDMTRNSIISSWVWLCKNFKRYNRKDPNSNNEYYIYVANRFNLREDGMLEALKQSVNRAGCNTYVLRSDLSYFPQDHYMEPLDRSTKEGLTVYSNEALCVVPNMKYLRHLSEYEWVFYNASTLEEIKLPSIKEPFIAPTDEKQQVLKPGYYDIKFRYKLSSDTNHYNEVSLSSAFIQVADRMPIKSTTGSILTDGWINDLYYPNTNSTKPLTSDSVILKK